MVLTLGAPISVRVCPATKTPHFAKVHVNHSDPSYSRNYVARGHLGDTQRSVKQDSDRKECF